MKNSRTTGQSFIKGAIIISLGGFISKVLGAVYRIPLTNILGGEGMGILYSFNRFRIGNTNWHCAAHFLWHG